MAPEALLIALVPFSFVARHSSDVRISVYFATRLFPFGFARRFLATKKALRVAGLSLDAPKRRVHPHCSLTASVNLFNEDAWTRAQFVVFG